jgi:hypothetical protein
MTNLQTFVIEPFFNHHTGPMGLTHFLAYRALLEAGIQSISGRVQIQIVMLKFGSGIVK